MLAAYLVFGASAQYFVYRSEQDAWQGRLNEAAANAAAAVTLSLRRSLDALTALDILGLDELTAEPDAMIAFLERYPTVDELIYIDSNGHILLDRARDRPLLADPFTLRQSRWYLSAAEGESFTSDVQFAADGTPYLVMAIPSTAGGVLAARLRMDVFWQVVDEARVGETGHVYVVTEDGQIIAHRDRALVISRRSIAERAPFLNQVAASGGRWFGEYHDIAGRQVAGAAVRVPETDWIVVAEASQHETHTFSRLGLILLVVVLGTYAALVAWGTHRLMSRWVVEPIEALHQGVLRIAAGDWSHRVPVERLDEVGYVATSFNLMAARLDRQRRLVQRYSEQLTLLHEIALKLTATLDLQAVVQTILEACFQLLPELLDVHVFLYREGQLQFASSLWADGRRDVLVQEPRPDGVTYFAAQSGEPVLVQDMSKDPRFQQPEWHGALAAIPLKAGSEVVGVMNVAYDEPHHFTEVELRTLQLFASQAAIAIRNAGLYDDLQQELSRRVQAEEALRRLNEELERRVEQRTMELAATAQQLQAEVELHRQTEAELRSITAMLRGLMENLSSGILFEDERHRVRYVNVAFSRMFNLPDPAEALIDEDGTSMIDRISDLFVEPDVFKADVERLVRLRQPAFGQELALKDGRTVERDYVPIEGQRGQVHHLWHYRDITEFKRIENALRQQAAELAAQNRELDAYAHTVAHDIRNPLALVVGYAEALERDWDRLSSDAALDALRAIARAGQKMSNIVDELLLLAEVRGRSVQMARLDMGAIVRETLHRLRFMIEEAGAEISVPDDAEWPAAYGYAPWVEEVWSNYISNAIKYGGRPPRVWLGACTEPDGQIRFWVRDNGPGLSAEDQARLFAPFTRLQQAHTAEGHGLGLSIVHRIVQKLGGRVGVDSEPGHGATFYFTLPSTPRSDSTS